MLIYAIILLFPFGQLTKITLFSSQINLYGHDIPVILLWLVFLLHKLINKEKIIWPRLTRLIVNFVVIAAFSLLLSSAHHTFEELLIAGLYLFRWVEYAGIYIIIYNLLNDNKIHDLRLKIYELLKIALITTAILGLLQYIFIPDIGDLNVFGWDPHYFRVVGTFLDSGFMGLILVLGLIMMATDGQWGWFGLIYIAFILTYSRSSYLAYIVGMVLVAGGKNSKKFLLISILLLALSLPLLPRPHGEGTKLERKSTINARIMNYRQAIKIAWDNPLFGIGFNNYRFSQKDYGFIDQPNWMQTHSGAGSDASILFILATTGLTGIISYILLITGIIKIGVNKNNKLNKFNLVLLAGTLALIVHSFFNNSLFYAWTMVWWWIMLGITEARDYKKL